MNGFLTDLGIVVGGLDATGFPPSPINAGDPLSQYYVGYNAFDPEENSTGFRQEYNPKGDNQVRHFLAGASIADNLGLPGIVYVRTMEEAPEDDALYSAAMTYVYFQACHPLSMAGSWVRKNLAK